MQITTDDRANIPATIHSRLLRVERRKRSLACAAGLIATAAALLVAMLIAMFIDWKFTLFRPNVRMLLTGTSLVIATVLLLAWVVVPFVRRKRLSDVAGEVDEAVPDLEERWSTVTELADSDDPPDVRGADRLIRQVEREAVTMQHLVDPEHVANTAQLKRCGWALSAVAALLFAAFLFDPGQGWVLFQRFWAPRSNISLTQVTSVTGDATVARGEPLEIAARLGNRKREEATFLFQFDHGETESVVVPARQHDAAAGDGRMDFIHKLAAVDQSFRYRVRSGDGESSWHSITAAERPQLLQVEFRITPPEYSQLPEQHESALPSRSRALEGSLLEVGFRADRPLARFQLKLDKDRLLTIAPDESGWYRYRALLDQTLFLSPTLVSQHGLENRRPPVCRIEVYPDRPPTVRVKSPGDTVAVRPDDTLQIEYEARDDFGIARAELLVYDDPQNSAAGAEGEDASRAMKVIEIPLDNQRDAKTAQGAIELDLKPFELEQGAELRYAVRVFDTRRSSSAQNGRLPQPGQPADQSNQQPAQQEADSSQPDERTVGAESGQQPPQSDAAQSKQESRPAVDPKSPQVAARQSSQYERPAQPPAGAPRPPDNRTKRMLDVAGQCTACRQRRIIIDEWADTYAGQALEKLQLAIDPYLKQLDQLLAAAEELTGNLVTELAADGVWNDARSDSANKAGRHLDEGLKVIDRLEGVTVETPYAFIGLQLVDIAASHVLPAKQHADAAPTRPPNERREEFVQAHFHIQRAREMLARLTRQYEAVKQNQQMAEQLAHIKKMHQLFIEGTFKLLGSKKPLLNPKQRALLELDLDEEFLNKLRELLERKRDIQAELAKALAKDPRLLKRFMARTRLEATTLRDQLTLLAIRQRQLHTEIARWSEADEQVLEEIAVADLRARQQRETAEIAEQAAAMYENFVTWTPLDLDPNTGQLAELEEATGDIAATASAFAQAAGLDDVEKAGNLGRQLYDKLQSFQQTIPESTDAGHERLAVHFANRLVETRQLITMISGWLRKEKNIAEGQFHRAAEVEQHRLAADTAELTRKLDNLQAWLAGMPQEIGELAGKLNLTLVDVLIPEQMSAEQSLERSRLSMAAVQQHRAVGHFATAEKQIDELMDKIIAFLDSQPAGNTRPNLDDVKLMTLEELLAMLENEARACESLGIPCCRPTNLSIQNDWLASGQGAGGGQGQSGQSGMGQSGATAAMLQSQLSQQKAEQLRQQALAEARRLAQQAAGNRASTAKLPDRVRWNTVASQLAEDLRQGRGTLPPQEYRRAIEQYFETISQIPDEPFSSDGTER